jgi:hypothetical protein
MSLAHATVPAISEAAPPRVGDRVRCERDETRYPPRSTWPRFRGRAGTIVEINVDRRRPRRTEYGIVFGKVTPRTDGRGRFRWSGTEPITWFQQYELRPVIRGNAAQRPAKTFSIVLPPVTERRRQLVELWGSSSTAATAAATFASAMNRPVTATRSRQARATTGRVGMRSRSWSGCPGVGCLVRIPGNTAAGGKRLPTSRRRQPSGRRAPRLTGWSPRLRDCGSVFTSCPAPVTPLMKPASLSSVLKPSAISWPSGIGTFRRLTA